MQFNRRLEVITDNNDSYCYHSAISDLQVAHMRCIVQLFADCVANFFISAFLSSKFLFFKKTFNNTIILPNGSDPTVCNGYRQRMKVVTSRERGCLIVLNGVLACNYTT